LRRRRTPGGANAHTSDPTDNYATPIIIRLRLPIRSVSGPATSKPADHAAHRQAAGVAGSVPWGMWCVVRSWLPCKCARCASLSNALKHSMASAYLTVNRTGVEHVYALDARHDEAGRLQTSYTSCGKPSLTDGAVAALQLACT